MRTGNTNLTVAGATMVGHSMSSSFNSDPVNLINMYAYSLQVSWSGGSSPVGTFTLQGSNDAGSSGNPNQIVPTNWTTITGSSQAISGTPGSMLYDVTECSYRWARLVYTATSGSATVSAATLNSKGV